MNKVHIVHCTEYNDDTGSPAHCIEHNDDTGLLHIALDTGAMGCGKYSTVPSAAYFSWQGCVSL